MPTPHDLGDLAEAMVPVAAQLVGAVHDEGIVGVARILSIVKTEDMPALAVVLAAMVDPCRTVPELLEWVTWDDVAPAIDSDRAPRLDDPREWADSRCHRLWREWRRVGAPRSYEARLGYMEWERRRRAHDRDAKQGLQVAG